MSEQEHTCGECKQHFKGDAPYESWLYAMTERQQSWQELRQAAEDLKAALVEVFTPLADKIEQCLEERGGT